MVAVLGWAFWRMNERRDAAIRELYEPVAELSRVQTAAITKMEAVLVALKEAITELNPAPQRGRQDSTVAERPLRSRAISWSCSMRTGTPRARARVIDGPSF